MVLFFSYNFTYAQCTLDNSIDCSVEDDTQTSCDLLPDITVSWQTGVTGSEEYPPGEGLQEGEINYQKIGLRLRQKYKQWEEFVYQQEPLISVLGR